MFVSSTLQELASERKAARKAVERLSAAPVMFELGARPHPPRSLYRAYLEQSDVFVGIYWQKYGWVAPGESVSGLEDEYDLAPAAMPKLIYVKETEGGRDPALAALLDRIRDDGTASYKHFRDARELARLLVADLAVLLAERFDDSRSSTAHHAPDLVEREEPPAGIRSSLPEPLTRLVGRDRDVEALAALIRSPDARLVTLRGPGGIGKTRLAIETARRVAPEFPDGAVFVPLAPVADSGQVASAIAQALGILAGSDAPLEERMTTALRNRRMLLVLDNFEQILPAAPLLPELLEGAPGVKMLVTSRALLRVSGERSYEVAPLMLPAASDQDGSEPDELPSSVELFLERARSVKPDFELSAATRGAVEGIVTRTDGLPLAIELAAARMRLLSPAELLARMDHQLSVLVGGQRDAPPRQQAVRSTIEWSTRLLEEDARDLLARLGVFAGRFSLEAAEAVADAGADPLAPLEALVDASLVRQLDRDGRTYFQLLVPIREYAVEQLERHGLLDEVRRRHADHYLRWTGTVGPRLFGPSQRDTATVLANERDNLRVAERHLLDSGRWDDAAAVLQSVWPFWIIDGMLGEARSWALEVREAGTAVPDRARAVALSFPNTRYFWEEPTAAIIADLEESADLFERAGQPFDAALSLSFVGLAYCMLPTPDLARASAAVERGLALTRAAGNPWGEIFLMVAAGEVFLERGDIPGGIERFEEALRLSVAVEDDLVLSVSLVFLGWSNLLNGSVEVGARHFRRLIEVAARAEHQQGIAWALAGGLGVAGSVHDVERAGLLMGAAGALRERIGMRSIQEDGSAMLLSRDVRTGEQAERFEEYRDRGCRLSTEAAVALALEVLSEQAHQPAA